MKRVTYQEQFKACDESGCLTDNRFFVVSGYLFDMIDSLDRFFVSVYDADGIYNASHGDELVSSYSERRHIATFEFETQAQANNWVTDQILQGLTNVQAHTENFEKTLAFYTLPEEVKP